MQAVADASDSTAPTDAVASALQAASLLLQGRGDYPGRRQAVIAANSTGI